MFHINLAWNSAKQLQNRTSGKEQTCSNEAVITQSPGHANSCCNVLWLLLLAELADLRHWSDFNTMIINYHILSLSSAFCNPLGLSRVLSPIAQTWLVCQDAIQAILSSPSQHHKRWNTTKKTRCSSVTASFVHCISTPGFLQIASNCAYTLALYFSRKCFCVLCAIFCHQFARCLFVAA